jgi:hypothetical protein
MDKDSVKPNSPIHSWALLGLRGLVFGMRVYGPWSMVYGLEFRV